MSAPTLRDRLRGSLQTRVYVLLVVTTVIPVGLLAWAFGIRVSRLDEATVAARERAVRVVAAGVDENLTHAFEVLQRAATAPRVDLENDDPEPEQAALRDPRVNLRFPAGAFFLDRSGRVVAEEPERGRSVAPAPGAEAVETALRSERPVVTPEIRGLAGEHAYALVPVRDWQGRVTGLVGAVVDGSQHDLVALLRALKQGPDGSAELLDRDGHVLASSEPQRGSSAPACAGIRSLVAGGRATYRLCADCHAARPQDSRGRAAVGAGAGGRAAGPPWPRRRWPPRPGWWWPGSPPRRCSTPRAPSRPGWRG